jgi:hypothetical protein
LREAEAAQAAGDRGARKEAVQKYEALLSASMHALGPEHPDTLITRHNLAYFQGMVADTAAAALAELLPVAERVLGPEHPGTLATRRNLALFRGTAGARATLGELLPIQKRLLGWRHPVTLATEKRMAEWRTAARRQPPFFGKW